MVGVVEPDVGPFVEQGAVEPFDLAVGLGAVGPGWECVDASRCSWSRQARLL